MNREQLLEFIDPTFSFEQALDRKATPTSFYLYEVSAAGFSDHLQVWNFENIEQFKNFLPALFFRSLVMEFSDIEDDLSDYKLIYNEYVNIIHRDLSIEEVKSILIDIIKNNDFKYLEFGSIADLIAITESQLEKCKADFYYDSENSIEEGFYTIIHRFIDVYNCSPKENIDAFLDFISFSINE